MPSIAAQTSSRLRSPTCCGSARTSDPRGDYRLVPGDDLSEFVVGTFDLVLSAFTFDNIPAAMKVRIFGDLQKLLTPEGVIVSLISSPEIYTHEWASFTTKDFPENSAARSGGVVRIIVTDHQDRRPVEDKAWRLVVRHHKSTRPNPASLSIKIESAFTPNVLTPSAVQVSARRPPSHLSVPET